MEQQLEILINREWIADWADRLMTFLADYGAWAPWLLLLLIMGVIFGNFRFRMAMLAAGLAIGLSDGVGVNVLKLAVGRPRPCQVEPGVRVVESGAAPKPLPRIFGVLSEPKVSHPQGDQPPEIPGMLSGDRPIVGRSFPSGHAANNMAVATVLILFYPRRGWFYLPVALLIAYSRIYTGAHWPLDVLAGLIIGIGGGWLATRGLDFSWRLFGSRLFPSLAAAHASLIGEVSS